MPLNIYSDIYKAFYDIFTDRTTFKDPRAMYTGQRLGQGIHNGFSKLLLTLNIVGVIPGSPPVPYVGVEPPFSPIFNPSGMISTLQSKYKDIYKDGAGSLYEYCYKEADAIANGVFQYFQTGVYPLTAHIGTVKAFPPPPSVMATQLTPFLMSLYEKPILASEAVKAAKMATKVQSSIQTWVSGISFTGNIAAIGPVISPTPLVPLSGKGTGVFL